MTSPLDRAKMKEWPHRKGSNLRLRTFGGLSLEAEPGERPAPSFGPRRLALLALIAASNAHGISREKILGILWPDVGEEQGRHTLSQTLYSIRRESGAPWVSGTTQVKLDSSLQSDVSEFLAALKSDNLEHAASLYDGQFLEGFYLGGAPEFERWVDETRARLHLSALKAIETLARRSDNAGDIQRSVDTWSRLTALEPLKAAYAAGYLRALMAAGDHAAALKVASEHESRVRLELEIEPEPVISQLIAQIKATGVSRETPAQERATTHTNEPEREFAQVERVQAHHFSFARIGVFATGSLIAALLLAAFSWQTGRLPWKTGSAVPLLAVGSIVSRDTAEQGAVLGNLLATNLARVRGIQVLSNTRLHELTARAGDSTQPALVDAAKRAGASYVFEGEIDAASNGLALTLRRVSVATGVVLQGYTLRAADIFALTDSATIAIARDFRIDPPSDAVASVRTRSAVAYALYDNGLSALSHSDASSAYELLVAALERDSTFAMAAAHAWSTAIVLQKSDDAERLLPIVKRLAANTVDRERLWIESLVAHYTGRPIREQVKAIEVLTRRFPADPDAQLLRGMVLFNAGDFAGSVEAFDRAVFIDSATAPSGAYCRVCGATYMMAGTYMWWDSLAAAERTARRLSSLRYKGKRESGDLIEVLLRQGRRAEAEEFLASLRAARPGDVFDFSGPLNRDLIRSGRLGELEASLLASLRTAPSNGYGEMPWLLLFTLRNQGRLDEAYALAKQGIVPTINVRLSGFHDPLSTAVVALERGDVQEAAKRFMEMVAAMRTPGNKTGPPPWARHMTFRMTLAGTALAAAGDTVTVKALADSISVIGQQSNWARDLRIHHFLLGLVHQRKNQHAQAVDEFRKSVFSLTDGFTRINVEMARSLLALGRNTEAIAVLRPALRGGVDGGNTYTTHTELHELMGHAFFAAAQRDSATVHYAAVERAWRGADARFAERYRIAKERATSGGL